MSTTGSKSLSAPLQSTVISFRDFFTDRKLLNRSLNERFHGNLHADRGGNLWRHLKEMEAEGEKLSLALKPVPLECCNSNAWP